MLYYLPLEAYQERYSLQWSAPVTGWLERNWRKINLPYARVDGSPELREPRPIKSGCVLDAVKRSRFCFSQVSQLLGLAEQGALTDDDVIYADDFWHPGFEALPYAFHVMGLRPKMYAFLHAQSVDEFDFTYPMRHWMRHFERGLGEVLDGVFVCCQTLKDLVTQGGIAPWHKVHITGHPFSSEEVLERMPVPRPPRENRVAYCSRWDREKNPDFFVQLALEVIRRGAPATFVVCTSSPKLRSNEPHLIDFLKHACQSYPGRVVLREGLSKEEYYAELCRAKVQFNCADQDFNPITLQEAAVAGCFPVYPYFRSFPGCLRRDRQYFYEHQDLQHAADVVCAVLARDDLWGPAELESRAWVYRQFDTSWLRMLKIMGLYHGEVKDLYED